MTTMLASPPQVKIKEAAVAATLADALVGLEAVLGIDDSRVTLTYQDDLTFKLFSNLGISVGDKLELSLPKSGGAATVSVFLGRVAEIGVKSDRGHPRIVVMARDDRHVLAVTSHVRTWLKHTAAAIVEEIAGDHDLKSKVDAVAAQQTFPHLLQTGTDRALLDQLGRRLGCQWWTADGTLHFGPRSDPTGPTELPRHECTAYDISYEGTRTPSEVEVLGWNPDGTAKKHAGTAKRSLTPMLGSSSSFVGDQHKAATAAFGQKLVIGSLATMDDKEAERLAGGLDTELLRSGLDFSATTTGHPAVKPGSWVRLKDFTRSLDGDYYVTEVVHTFAAEEDLRTTIRSSSTPSLPEQWSAGAAGDVASQGLGPLLGTVTDTHDPESHGRVKVKFPSLGGEVESDWARVVAPGAGKDRGFDMRPQVDDVVLVVFEHGDTRFPLVLGGVWTKQVTHADPKVGDDSKVPRSSMRTRAGSVLSFFDDATQPTHAKHNPDLWDVEAKGGIGMTSSSTDAGVLVADDGIVVAAKDKPITLTNGKASIKLLANGNIELEGVDLKVTMTGSATVKSAKKMALQSDMEVHVKGPMGEVKAGSGPMQVKAAAILELKGAMVKVNG